MSRIFVALHHCHKLLGDTLVARSFYRQVNEIHGHVELFYKYIDLGRIHHQVVIQFRGISVLHP